MMGTNELGEKTVRCIANRNRLFYFQRMLSAGDTFECDERTARNWERTGSVTIVQERPSFKEPPAAAAGVDPALAAAARAESGQVKPPHEARAAADAPLAFGAESKPDVAVEPPKATAEPQTSATATSAAARSRYDRRDVRAKP